LFKVVTKSKRGFSIDPGLKMGSARALRATEERKKWKVFEARKRGLDFPSSRSWGDDYGDKDDDARAPQSRG